MAPFLIARRESFKWLSGALRTKMAAEGRHFPFRMPNLLDDGGDDANRKSR